MRVSFVREQKSGRIRVGIGEGDEALSYSLSHGTVEHYGLVRGAEIDARVLNVIAGEDEMYRAMKRALSLLSYGDNTKRALYVKLLRSGFGREVSESVISECIRLGYIDEERQIERAVINEANRALRGRAYILKKLCSKGYSAREITDVVDRLVDSGEVDFEANFERLADKMGATGDEELRALRYKYGYRSSDFD